MNLEIERRTYTVLLVDDDNGARRVVARRLMQEGHDVVEAIHGIAALRLLHSTVVDLIVTDIIMPEMEGLELLRILSKRPTRPKVIAISGGGRGSASDYLEMAKHFGADATLRKTFTKVELVDEINRVMARD